MRKSLLIALFVFSSILMGHAQQNQSFSPTTQPLATLRIEIVDLRAAKGQLILGIFPTADGFPTECKKSVSWQTKLVDSRKVVFECQLPPGRYGTSVLHDENKNGKMDYSLLGIPTEGYGVTNNPKPKLRAATFEESLITLPPEGATYTISVQYF